MWYDPTKRRHDLAVCHKEPPAHGYNLGCGNLWHFTMICMQCDKEYFAVGLDKEQLERRAIQDRLDHYEYHELEER